MMRLLLLVESNHQKQLAHFANCLMSEHTHSSNSLQLQAVLSQLSLGQFSPSGKFSNGRRALFAQTQLIRMACISCSVACTGSVPYNMLSQPGKWQVCCRADASFCLEIESAYNVAWKLKLKS